MTESDPTSKKRSGVKSTSLPELPVLFLDQMLGRRKVPDLLRQAGIKVEVHDDHFRQGTPDEVWLAEVGKRGWIVLTRDKRIRRRATELAALVKAKVGAFVLTSKDMDAVGIASAFINALPTIRRYAASQPRPFIATFTKSGDVKLIYPSR